MSALRARYCLLARDSRQEKPLSFPTLLWLFIAGSLLGFVMEGVWHFLHTGEWGFRVATLWGPFCIIYGAGNTAVRRRLRLLCFVYALSIYAAYGGKRCSDAGRL